MAEEIKMGLLLGAPLPSFDRIYKIAKRAEDFGFDSFWLPDHLLMIPSGFMPDVWNVLSGLTLKTDNIEVGTGVTDPHRRHPAVLAQSSATLGEMSEGRFNLGIGAGEAMNLDPFGISWNKPVTRMVESVEIMKDLWQGKKVNYEGEFFETDEAFLQIEPEEKIPIYMGANGPRTRRLTGKMADGWMPIAENPSTYEKHLEEVREGVEESGRPMQDLDPALQIYTGITENDEELNNLRIFPSTTLAGSPEKLEAAGYNVDLGKDLEASYYFKELRPDNEAKFYELSQEVPNEAADDFAIFGNKEDCISKIESFIDAGVRHFCFINIGPDPKKVLRIYGEEILPYLKE